MDKKNIQFYVGIFVSIMTLIVLSYNLRAILREEREIKESETV